MTKGRWILFCAVVLLVIAAVIALTGRQTVCPAIMYFNTSPIELRFARTPDAVSACFGPDCKPAEVRVNDDGRWLVPQEPPYAVHTSSPSRRLAPSLPVPPPDTTTRATPTPTATAPVPFIGGVRSIRVVSQTGGLRLDAVYDIHTRSLDPFSPCPGRYEYLPVEVG
ncbi:hypothetical protein [Arthrobacter cavernae]|uniref:Uncharacterized protein n=1 Tax=Arthrobacter cavernae TaxID=2817681 RepID=A0A939HGV7_9MICC|nr:hypothetical protein [Arthrobacter cavernae]MBO1268210.1 hypothetical protein [Arthrobacter cavernae]